MSEYLTEQEQVQLIKNWIKTYGMTILTGIALALFLSWSWRYYQNYRLKIAIHASNIYDEMLTAQAKNDADNALVQANKLLTHYPRTPYAQMAAFLLARDAAIKKDYPNAIQQLDWVIAHTHNDSIKEIARIRIARIHLANKKPEDAISTLQKLDDKTFLGLVDEVRGDAYLAMNDATAAKKSYQSALKEIPNAESNRPILEMKYENLAAVDANG